MKTYKQARKALCIALSLCLLVTSEGALFAATDGLVFEKASTLSSGMSQVPLTERKISDLSKYLLQNRSPIATSTLLEAGQAPKYLELDSTKLKNTGVTASGNTNYSFSYGKALYDSNIAIVDLPTTNSGRYTYEAPYYCDLLVSSLAKFVKIGNNICLPNYQTFLTEYNKNPLRTYINVIKTSEIKDADLSKYGTIIFPDIILGKHPEILNDFGSGGIAKIQAFVDNGGMAYFSSKSLILADKMNLTSRAVDENTLIKHHANQGKILLQNGNDFNTQVLNQGFYEGTNYQAKSGSGYYEYLLGSYFVRPTTDPAIVPVRYFDVAHDQNYYFQDLTTSEDAPLDIDKTISAFYKPYGKGLIVYNGGNSLFSPQSNSHKLFINHTLNSIYLSFLREIYSSAKVIQKSNPDVRENLVPALERNLILEYSMNASNVFNGNVTNLTATIDVSTGGLLIDTALPADCNYGTSTGQIICTKSALAAGTKWDLSFGLRVDEPTFTQAGTNIVVTRTRLEYTDSNGARINQNMGAQTIDAVESANMRASLNIDPAGYYPLPGAGVYIDQVLNAENKGSTEATSVDYTVSVPMLSPLFDESDQNRLISRIVFSKDYHNNLYNPDTKTNYYPFKNEGDCAVTDLVLPNRCKDYVIPKLASGSVDYMSGANRYQFVDNYDEPVYRAKTDADEAWANIHTGVLSPDLGANILRQSFMPDADRLFRKASPRKMVFEYPAKKELLFARQDVYFYNNPAFPLPNGISGVNQFISMDKRGVCEKEAGKYGYPDGVIAGKYGNALACDASGALLPWINQKINYDNLPQGVEKSDYLFPISPENNITGPEMLDGFDADGNYIGQKDESGNTSEAYPIKYLHGSYASFYLPPRSTPKGGYLEFTLPDGVSPSKVYVLADHIAITKTETTGQTTRVYFYRGKLPNEQSLKSIIGLALEGVNQDIPNISVKVYSLMYDLSSGVSNRYDFEQNIPTAFTKYDFFKLPAVKLTFSLPRRKRIQDTDIASLNLTEGQVNVLFTRPDYYDHSLVFKSNALNALVNLMGQAGLSDAQKSSLTSIYQVVPTESYVRKYENLEPMVRFGTYIQELAFHRTVWGVAEDHPISDPGIMADKAMFGNVGTVGINPIPFREYLTTGASQIIPLATENARVDYNDIFGRKFAAPIRTVVPEAVPLPPPLRNFEMNTTYEMYDKDGKRKQTWDGESELEIRQNIKLYNNYPRFFDPTTCNDNPSSPAYGTCWDGTGSTTTGYDGQTDYKLSDKILDSIDNYWIRNVRLFETKAAYDTFMADLQAQLTASGLTNYSVPTLHRAEDGKGNIHLASGENIDDSARNYSPEVENYYPKNYVENSMWNLTHFDYDDSVYSKGYPYHMDNQLPNPRADDYWNPAKYLPHNILAIPVYRGVGYKMKYFSQEPSYLQFETQNNGRILHNVTPYSSWKYTGRKGWWPENLQSRDMTLLAGQDTINRIPYAYSGNDYLKSPLISQSDFTLDPNQHNIYSCLFNPNVLNDKVGKYQYKSNVLLNNVIPMIPWIQKENENASYLSKYSCNIQEYKNIYSNENRLNEVNNIVETEDAYWLYFASNLRGEAKEGLNVINRLQSFPGSTLYEGDTKVIEGGRFVYWNPGLGPNAFEIVDNPVSVVKSVNSDITVDKELLPYTLKNYKTDAYLLYTIKDPGELFVDSHGKETARPWKDEVYIDSRGNGNYGASVYVGASYNKAATKSLLDPGDKTLIRLDIYNNSGYDWAMLGSGTVANTNNNQYKTYVNGGIDFTIEGNQALNANDLISKVARNVLKPDKYNFLKLDIPEDIKPYVTVTPSDANILTPGTFFDFDFVNVTTIRDGFKGSYFLDLKVDPSIPDSLRAKVYDIKATLDPQYFQNLPGIQGKDPVAWPDTPELPNIRFAVADINNNAFYRSGYSTGISLDVAYDSGFTLDTAYELSEDGVNEMRLAAGDGTNKHRRLRETFENLSASGFALRTFTGSLSSSGTDTVAHLDFSSAGMNEFPYITASGTITPKTYVLVHLKRDELSDGEHPVENSDTIHFTNFAGKEKAKSNTIPLKGYAQGPKLDIWYRSALIGNTKNDQLEVQKLAEGENTVEVKLFLKNIGTDVAFDPTLTVNVGSGVVVDPNLTKNATIINNQITIHNLYSESGALGAEGEAVGPGITNYFPIYLTYSGAYQDTPVELVNSAGYVFTPYDPILPSLSGSYSTGFTLDFIKTLSTYERQGSDTISLTLSGNTSGVYWDTALDGSGILSKVTNTGSEVLVDMLSADPLQSHMIDTTSYYRTKGGEFKSIKGEQLSLTGTQASLSSGGYKVTDSTADFTFQTNALGKYGYNFTWSATQGSGSVYTGAITVPSSGALGVRLDGIDVMAPMNLDSAILDASGNILTTNHIHVPLIGARITDQSSRRTGEHTRVQFSTNYLTDTCFDITRDGLKVLECKNTTSGPNVFEDVNADPYKDHAYHITVYKKGNSEASVSADVFYISAPDTSSIPLKIISASELHDTINFNKVKDLLDNYVVDETLIRYIVRMRADLAPYLTQYSDDGAIEVRYASGQTIYAGADWDKIIDKPLLIVKDLPNLTGYTPTQGVEAGDTSTPFVFENYNLIILKDVWKKPAKMMTFHGSAQAEIPECKNLSKITESCWYYDTNKVGIYTNKFSKFVLYDSANLGGSAIMHADYCPSGDTSPSYYDGICETPQTSVNNKAPDMLKTIEPEQQSLFDTYDFSASRPLSREIRNYIEVRYLARINAAIERKTDSLYMKILIYNKVVAYLDNRLKSGNLSPRDEKVFGYIRLQLVRAISRYDSGAMVKR